MSFIYYIVLEAYNMAQLYMGDFDKNILHMTIHILKSFM